ncbi:MAG TPA: HNH endonuclease signature motif containing protein [Acidimicrobiia bacterium]|nr:HNH endonuclease signature motif containing protein [Acidimicrobiia bacterium]
MAPGAGLGKTVAAIDSPSLSRYDRVQLICAYQRLIAHYQGSFYQEIARLWDQEQKEDPEGSPEDSAWAVKTELGAALHLSNRSVELVFDFALLLERASGVLAALSAGKIDLYRAQVLVNSTCHLPDQDVSWVIDQVLEEAEHLTAGQIRVRVERLCFLANPEKAALNYGEAIKNRMVEVRGNEFGTATLQGHDLSPDRAEAAYRPLTRLARKLKRKGEDRTMDQLRADLLLELLLGESENQGGDAKGGSVDLRVDLETLAGLSEAPGELSGFGPVIADIARQVTREQGHCQWRFTVTDPETGMPIHTGVTRRRPRQETRRLVEARNPTCVFPGCRRSSRDCDLDHRQLWSERGPTCECNLVPLCRRHHLCRHRLGWRHQPLSRGDHLWISPLGHRYTTSGRPP